MKTLFSFPFILLLLIATVFPFVSGLIPIVRFTSERIDVHVYPQEIVVVGYYFYKNPFPFPVVQGFTIPFSVDPDHPEPIDVHVVQLLPERKEIGVRHTFAKTGFDVFFSAREATEIKVTYRQKAGGMNATYILKTTQPWGRPLENGVYSLYPHGTKIESSNYPLDLASSVPGFRKTGFMPGMDWQFTWRPKDEKAM